MTPPVPLQQSRAFVRAARRLAWPVHERAEADLRWVETRRTLPGMGAVALVSRGPLGAAADWLAAPGGLTVLNADGPDPATLRAAGWWPLLTPGTVALLPLGDADSLRAGLSGTWRNRLARAEEAGMRVTRRPLPPDPDHWILAAEARQARARGYRGWPPRLAAAYAAATPGGAQLFVAERAGAPLAGLVLLVHEGSATWQIGVSGPEGRQAGAMPLLLWRAMLWAAARGLAQLDLGTLNTDDAPGLARFKLGTGARAHRLGGTWLHAGALAPLARTLPRAWT